tara:strand:- start:215 stop:9274 length:9060 start_codon:yes stop_codon:yes gene_type:complete
MYYGGSTDFGFYCQSPSVNGSFISWQAAGLDANGVLQDPGFYAYGDGFHLETGNDLATPLTEITIDFDNEPRDETTPDIGADEYISPNYDGVVEVPGEITTIQGAIAIAVSGDSIKVAAGTYTENIDFSGKNIVVIGAGRETTIIDGNQSESVVKFISGEDSTAVLMGFTITNGAAESGGGIHLDQSSPSLYDLTVSQNTSTNGGGIYCDNQSNPILKNSSVVNNSADQHAGGIRCWNESNIKLNNVLIADNTAFQFGGGMQCGGNSSPTLMNVTIINNNADDFGGGLYLRNNSNPIIVNSIVWGNTPQNIYFRAGEGSSPGYITFSYSDLQGGQDSIVTNDNGIVTWGDGNIDLDPLFLDADSGNYHLSDLSPVISAAIDSVQIESVWYFAPTTDADGDPRPSPENTLPDMGAYENENGAGPYNGPVWYVDASSELPYANGSENAKFSKVQYGIDAASSGDTVLVAVGTYVENIDFSGKNIAVFGADQETTIIDGNQAGSVVTFQSGELPQAVLRGFTLQNGLEANGGGIYCTGGSSPSLHDLIITNNSATGNNGRGGGLRCTTNSDPILVNVLISDNTATQEGGGIFCNNSNPSFVNVTVGRNVSSIADGGGLFIQNNSNVNLLNTIIASNDSNDLEFSSSGDPSTITLLYSNIDGGQDSIITNDNGTVIWGEGSLDVDPLFVDADNGDFSLTVDSRCIDTGHPDSTDADGTIADMGSYYYDQSDQPVRVYNLITTPSSDNISVKWSANSDAASYNIYRSTDVSTDFYSLSPYSTASDTSYLDESAEGNTTYHYRVSAVDSESDEGIFAFARHGRTGNDTTALSMSADDRWISVSGLRAPVFSPEQDYTVEFYFRPLDYGNEAQTMLRAGSLSLDLIPFGSDSFKIHLVDESGEFTGGNRIPIDSGWHHLAVTSPAGGDIRLWLDGHLDVEDNGYVTLLGNSGVDFNSADPSSSYEGILDEVRFSNLLRYTSAFIPPGEFIVDNKTLALWRLNEGSFDEGFPTIYDWSGNGYHGLVSSSTNPDWVSGSPIQPEGQPAFVINELMPNPNGSDGGKEWIELYNNYYTPLNLQDWIISGSGNGETVTLSVDRAIPSGGYALLAQDGDSTTNGGIVPDIVYGTGVSFGNNDETVTIKVPLGTVVDSVTYSTEFPYSSGLSMELIVPQWDNNDTMSWVAAGIPYGDGNNLGSPGRKNDSYSGIIQSSIVAHNFSYITQGESDNISFWIENVGVNELIVSQISTATEVFSVNIEQAALAAADSLEIEIQFTPADIGEYTDTVSIISDDPYNPVVTIAVSGTAVNEFADIVVSYGENDSISFFNFPFTRVNDTRLDTLLITNAGTPDLEIEEIFIEGDGFSTSIESGLVSFMDTLLIPITFAPEAEGTYSASLVINCPNDLDEATYTIQLNGQASDHIILLVPEVYATIQSAISAAYLEDTVQVASGTYEELLHFGDKNLVLRSEMGSLETFIEGDGSGSVVTIAGGQTNTTQVLGFTITGGGGTDGGGLRIDSSSSPIINNMIIVENNADEGAGVYIKNSSPVFGYVVIKNNEATGDGGGIAIRENSNPIFNSVLITNNNGDNGGSILVRDNSSPVFNNLTLASNQSQSDGGAIYIRNGSNIQFTNSIVWNNGTESIYFSSTGSASQITVDYSIVDGGEAVIVTNGSTVNWGTGNLEDDPLFGNQYSLQWGSPAIDAGDPAGDPDLDGTITDMGALYYDQTFQPPNPPVSLSYVPGSGEVTLSWTANTEADLSHYVVFKGPAPDSLNSLAVVTAPTTEYVDTALNPSMINYYALTAVDTASLESDTTSVMTVSFPTFSTSDDVLSFGDIRVGITKTMQLTLSNTGSDTLYVDSIYVADSLSGFSVALGEMNTSSSLIERIAISKSRPRMTPSDRSGSKGRETRLSSKNKSSSQSRSLNNNADPKKANIPVRPGSFSLGKSPVSIGKQFNQLTSNSVLTISTEVMPGESIGLDVSFMRDDTLTVADELRITSDDPLGNDEVSIGLSARNVAPVLVLAVDTLDFGNILSESQLGVMVSNEGSDTLHVSAISLPSGFSGSLEDSTLAPGEAAELTVSITPEDNGYWTGDVLLTTDSYLQSEHSVTLSALSMNVLLVHDFGGVLTSLSSDTTFTLHNTGNTDLVLDSLATGQEAFTTDLADGTTLSSGGSQSIAVTFLSTTSDTVEGAVVLYTALGSINFGTLAGDGWNWPETQFAAKSLSVVTAQGDNVFFNIGLANSGDYPLEYTTTVDAEFAGFNWLTTDEGGQVLASGSIDLLVNVQQTENLDPGTYSGSIYFSTNTGGVDPDLIITNTDTVDVFLTLLIDDSQLADTTMVVESGNTEAIVFIDENGDSMGIIVDFANSNGGSITVKSIAAQPPVDENTPWVDPDDLITEPVFPAKYFEITTNIEGDFLTDIGFDYTALPGIEDPLSLRLAKRPGNAGLAEPWSVIAISSMEYNISDGLILAQNQTSFSQWAMLSNVSENSFIDTQGPAITNVVHGPDAPSVLEDVTITADMSDGTGIAIATLYYKQGSGNAYESVAMIGSSGSYAGTIPGSAVTMNGLFYYVGAQDPLGYNTSSDITGVSVNFSAGSLTTNSATGSAYPNGLPMDKWRLISIPAVLDETGVGLVIGDELGTQNNEVWKLFEYDQTSSSYRDNPIDFIMGESYWLYQRVEENLLLGTPAGETGNMSGTSLVIIPGWNFIGSPYSFEINISLDQEQFYGPITYGLAAEAWSSVVTVLDPWNGYAVYNRTTNNQTITLDPTVSSGSLAARVSNQEKGWLISLAVKTNEFQDRFNTFGALETADNGLEWHDNPEITAPGRSISLAFLLPEEERNLTVTSDVRALDDQLKIWDARIRTQDLESALTLTWAIEQSLPVDKAVQLLDLNTRTVMDMLLLDHLELGLVDSHYDRQIKIISGDPAVVAGTISNILALIPVELSLDGNYPNPFNPVTTIRYSLPEPRKIRITVIDLLGQEIIELVNDWKDIGRHKVQWQGQDYHGRSVASGMYFTVMSDGHKTIVQKMLLLK